MIFRVIQNAGIKVGDKKVVDKINTALMAIDVPAILLHPNVFGQNAPSITPPPPPAKKTPPTIVAINIDNPHAELEQRINELEKVLDE